MEHTIEPLVSLVDEPHSHANLSPYVDQLLSEFEKDIPIIKTGSKYRVSRTVSALAVLYEKARNAVEFRAEHLVRRAAIERILKRLIFLIGNPASTAENLILELLWARYIDSSVIDDGKVTDIRIIIEKYMYIKQNIFQNASQYQGVHWDTLMGVASAEIDESIVSARKRIALNNFFYQAQRQKIIIGDKDERYINMLVYIAVERSFAQADEALITCHTLKLMQPEWFGSEFQNTASQYDQCISSIKQIQEGLRDPITVSISRFITKHTPPFLLIRDFLLEHAGDARNLISKSSEFDNTLTILASKRYNEIGVKVRRAVVRSIIYIFLTKMVFALALEVPFDMFISKKIEYLAIGINTLFPPVMLFLIAGFFSVPGAENTKLLIARIHNIMFGFAEVRNEQDLFQYKPINRRPVLTAIFSLFYLATFVLVFGLINWVLTRLNFNIASKIIFVFFITLVSFFAYRIRQSAKEYEIVDRQGVFEPIFDFFFLPVLHAGHWLSGEIAKLNIFIVLFDFILEAPLKTIFEIFEEWIRFVRTKKEEII